MAGTTRLELATSAVTGQRSNQLNYVPALAVSARETIPLLDIFRSIPEITVFSGVNWGVSWFFLLSMF